MNIIRYTTPRTSAFDRFASLSDLLAYQLTGSAQKTRWTPLLDVFESDEKYTVQLELAGVKKEDFDISLEDGVLTIAGERKTASTEAESLRSERLFGAFSRSVTLASPVKGDAVTASYQDGVLSVSLPKAEEAKPRKIQVDLN
ncbi:Hsp20/alpha crystallin family protein [soil metagenome]